ncbi:MAG: acyltransferase [Actinomycetota bacterium]|nr:acyltransferase [Actinomycetota bacterium]
MSRRSGEPEAQGSGGVAGAVPAPASNPRFPLLDSLRAVAALAVVVAHTAFASEAVFRSPIRGILAHLNFGVTLFFLISGFVLYRPFAAARARRALPPSLSRYARRRFLRIAPAYWVALTVLGVFPGLYGVFTGDWWVYYGLLQPYPVYQPAAECLETIQGCGIAPTWSLSVEVAFYAVLPLYALAVARMTRGTSPRVARRRDLALLAALSVASVVVRLWVVDHPRLAWVYVTVVAHFLWFALGMGLAVVSVSTEGREARSRFGPALRDHPSVPWAAGVGAFLILTLYVLPVSASPFHLSVSEQVVEHAAFGLIALALMLPAVFGDHAGGFPRRLLGSRPLRWLGQISYGIFLWHLPVMFELADHGANEWLFGNPLASLTLCTLAVTIPLAAASYYVVERPLMRATWRGRGARATVAETSRLPETAGV